MKREREEKGQRERERERKRKIVTDRGKKRERGGYLRVFGYFSKLQVLEHRVGGRVLILGGLFFSPYFIFIWVDFLYREKEIII